jgi:hypothetical protein
MYPQHAKTNRMKCSLYSIGRPLSVLSYVNATLESGAALGPSVVKALAGAIAIATAELRQLGILDMDDAEVTTELWVRVLTDAEHDEIKLRVSQPDDYGD